MSLYVDVEKPGGAPCLLDEKNSSPLDETLYLMQGDKFGLRVYFRQRGSVGSSSTAVDLPADFSLAIAAKETGDLPTAVTVLFSATAFSAVGADDDRYYSATLDLNTSEIATALGSDEDIAIKVDLEVRNVGNTERTTYRFAATLLMEAYSNEADPTPGTPTYPAANLVVAKYMGPVAIDAAADSVAVTGLALSFVPAAVLVSVRKPAGGDNIWATVRDATLAADGFTADLSAAPGTAGYKLDYLLIEAAT